tara:strand:- start:1073 stop:1618 length:546 start_codon:yes stop_codon:yes gene_type:complete
MALSSLNLVQQLSANLTSTGIKGNNPVGGANDVTLTSDDADYMYEFTIDSGHADNQITWNLATNQLSDTGTGADAYVSQPLAVTMRDANGDAVHVPDASGDDRVVAIYYETEAANTGTVTILASNNMFGDLTFNSGEGTTSGTRVPRSALIVPRWEASTGTITFDFSVVGDKIHVVFLGKT